MQDDMDRKTPREVAMDARPGDVLWLRDETGAVVDLQVIGRMEAPQDPLNLTAVRLDGVAIGGPGLERVQIVVPVDPKVPTYWTKLDPPTATTWKIVDMQITVPVKAAGVRHKVDFMVVDDVEDPEVTRDLAVVRGWFDKVVARAHARPNAGPHHDMDLTRELTGPIFDREMVATADQLFRTVKAWGVTTQVAVDNLNDLAQANRDKADPAHITEAAPPKPTKTADQIAEELSVKASILEAKIAATEKRVAEMSALPKLADPGYPEWANVPDSGEILALGEGIRWLDQHVGAGDGAEAQREMGYLLAVLRRLSRQIGNQARPGWLANLEPFRSEMPAAVKPTGITWPQAKQDEYFHQGPVGDCLDWANDRPVPCTLTLGVRDGELEIELADVEAGQITLYDGAQTAVVHSLTPQGVRLATEPSFVPWWRVFAGTVAFLRRDPPDQAEAVGGQP